MSLWKTYQLVQRAFLARHAAGTLGSLPVPSSRLMGSIRSPGNLGVMLYASEFVGEPFETVESRCLVGSRWSRRHRTSSRAAM